MVGFPCLNGSISSQQYLSLFQFYELTDGPHWSWKNETFSGAIWNFTNPTHPTKFELSQPCRDHWQGLTCESAQLGSNICGISSLILDRYRLFGPLPAQLSGLTDLRELSLGENILFSTVPSKIGNLVQLKILDLRFNHLSGAIPSALFKLSILSTLNLQHNDFNGKIPLNLGSLSFLQTLILSSNNFQSTLPDIFSGLTSLSNFDASNSHFDGTLPSSLFHLPLLTKLDLSSNLFSEMPSQFGGLTALKELRMSHNAHMKNGSLPSDLGLLTNLTILEFSTTNRTGPFPSQLTNLTNLEMLSLRTNNFTGLLPNNINQLNQLQFFDLGANHFSGPLPPTLFDLTKLRRLYAFSNHFSGLLSTNISKLTNLIILFLNENEFSGPLPSGLGSLSNLFVLYISNNAFRGPIPSEIGNLTTLIEFSCNFCQLTGSLPQELGQLSNLNMFQLANNLLTSTIPSTFQFFFSLYNFQLEVNRLTGTIPTCLGMMKNVSFFTLASNHLTGPIPSQIFNIPTMENLELSLNYLTSTLPSEIAQPMVQIYLATNYISGTIPSSFFNQSALYYVIFESNWISGTLPTTFGPSFNSLGGDFNYLTGQIPSSLFGSSFDFLILSDNFLTGSLPSFNSSNLVNFNISSNFFSGSIPLTYSKLKLLVSFDISTNFLTGFFPSELGLATSLLEIFGNNNLFTGTLPSQLENLQQLQLLDLQNNQLVGTIPTAYCQILSLQNLILINNSLTGQLPSCLFTMNHLQGLFLTSNCFSGSIPSLLHPNQTQSSQLQVLNLNDLTSGTNCMIYPFGQSMFLGSQLGFYPRNFIHGTLPSFIWNLPQLTSLYLSGNGLSGPLRIESFNPNSKLVKVSLSYNRFTGTVPLALQHYGKFQWLDLSHNRFSGTLDSNLKMMNYQEILPDSDWTFNLIVNRLSGWLPNNPNLTSMIDLVPNVLEDNMFQFNPNLHLENNAKSSADFNGSDVLTQSLIFSGICVLIIFSFGFLSLIQVRLHTINSDFLEICNSIFRWRSQVLSFLHQEDLGSMDTDPTHSKLKEILLVLKNCVYFFNTIGSLFLLLITLFVLILKLEPHSSSHFSTQQFQYSWIISTSFLHGKEVSNVIMVFLSILLLLILRISDPTIPTFKNLTTKFISILSFSFCQNIFSHFKKYFQKSQSILQSFRNFSQFFNLLFFIFVISINIVVMLIVNVIYLQIAMNDIQTSISISFFQFLLAFFKSSWNFIFIPIVLKSLRYLNQSAIELRALPLGVFLSSGLALNLFNNLMAPCIATILTDGSCLLPLFIQPVLPPTVVKFTVCAGYSSNVNIPGSFVCVAGAIVSYTVGSSLFPPFVYSYSCSSTLIIQYTPLLIYLVAFSGLIHSILFLICLFIPQEKPIVFLTFAFPILKWTPTTLNPDNFITSDSSTQSILTLDVIDSNPIQSLSQSPSPSPSLSPTFVTAHETTFKRYINDAFIDMQIFSLLVLIKLLLFLAVFLTFGLAYPPLGGLIILSVWMVVEVWFIAVGRLLSMIDRESIRRGSETDSNHFIDIYSDRDSRSFSIALSIISSSTPFTPRSSTIDQTQNQDQDQNPTPSTSISTSTNHPSREMDSIEIENRKSQEIIIINQISNNNNHHQQQQQHGFSSNFNSVESDESFPSVDSVVQSPLSCQYQMDIQPRPSSSSSSPIQFNHSDDAINSEMISDSKPIIKKDSQDDTTDDRSNNSLDISHSISQTPPPLPIPPSKSMNNNNNNTTYIPNSLHSLIRTRLIGVICVTLLFWSLQFFDQIGDVLGFNIALERVILFLVILFPILLILIFISSDGSQNE